MAFPHLQRLLDILERLRGPAGCPWDRAQTLATAARYLADEVHEYADVAVAADLAEARKELADLLYMVCFNWQLLNEQSPIAFDELAQAGAEKLVRRHPHVFGDARAHTEQDSQLLWNRIKAEERAAGAGGDPATAAGATDKAPASVLKSLAPSVSPLRQAALYGSSAADVGFDWLDAAGALRKLDEELGELRHAVGEADATATSAELGDVLFAAVQSARKLGIDPDAALREANRRFARRFHQLESAFGHDPQRLRAASPAELLDAWRAARERCGQLPPAHPSSGQPSSSERPL